MGGFSIVQQKSNEFELDFGNEEDISKSYNKIKTEYLKKRTKLALYFFTILLIIIIHFAVISPIYLIPDETVSVNELSLHSFPLTINWAIFSAGIFIIIYLIRVLYMRVTPLLKSHLTNEINNIGFKIQEKKNSWILFLTLNSLSLIFLVLIELKIIKFDNPILYTFLRSTIIFYLIIAISIPIIWRISYDGLIIKLKGNYKISINLYFKARKIKAGAQQLIGIYLTSNRIANKLNNDSNKLYKRIAEDRWLPRKRKSIISKYGLSPFLRFHEFSTPSNFQKQFLNIVIALQEWDMQAKKIMKRLPK